MTLLLSLAAFAQTARVVLRWKALPGANGYQVQIAKEAAFSQIVLDEKVQEPVLKWESLPATTFYWRVRSFDGEGRASEWSAPRQIAPATGAPTLKLPADAAALVCSVEPTAFALEPSAVLKEYVLEFSPDGRFAPGDTTVLTSKTGEFKSVLPVGTTSWRGRGVDLTGRSTEPSLARKVTVKLAAPRPKTTADVPVGAGSVTLSWVGAACAQRYVVEASLESPERAAFEAADTSTSFKPAGVGEYRFRVAARDDHGNQSDWSPESSFRVRLPAPVGRAENVRPSEGSTSDVELAWTAAAQASSYLVEIGRSDGFRDARTATVPGLGYKTKLAPGRYVWRVTARDSAGHLSFSSEPRSILVSDTPPPEKVALLFPLEGASLARAADGMIGISWTKSGAAVSHELDVDGTPQPVAMSPARISLSDGDHVLRVRAVGAGGKSSDWSDPVHFFFGSSQVARAEVSFGREPLRCDGTSTSRVEIRLLDANGTPVTGVTPVLSVDRGSLSPASSVGGVWITEWRAPAELPAEKVATLSVRDGTFNHQQRLRLAPQNAPLTVGAMVGGRFNFGAVASPSATLSLAYRAPQLGGRLTAHVRTGLYGAAATIATPDGPIAARALMPSMSLLVGTHLAFTHQWSFLAVVGGGLQVTAASVGAASQTTVLPSFELAVAAGRRLGPGSVEVELSYLYSQLNIPLARLVAGGLFVGIGYRFDLLGG